MSGPPGQLDHYRPVDERVVSTGVYRVVGRPDGDVVLLHVADEGGQRVHTGRIETVPLETFEAAFESAPDPDESSVWTERLTGTLRSVGLALIVVAFLVRMDLFAAQASPGTLALVGLVTVALSHLFDRRGLSLPSLPG